VIFLFGCYTEKKALNDMEKANDKHPDVVAKFVLDKYPCTEKSDSTILYDTVYRDIEVLCPPQSTIDIHDTIYRDGKKLPPLIKTIVSVPVPQKTIIKWYEDSAKIKIYAVQNAKLIGELSDCGKKKENKSEWIKWLLICLGISVILNLIQLRK
jgi:hypothetical protein